MAMNLSEMIEFLETQARESESIINIGIDSKNYELASSNMVGSFHDYLRSGLLRWRQDSDPTNALKNAVNTLLVGMKSLKELDPNRNPIEDLPLSISIYLASLLDLPHPSLDIGKMDGDVVMESFIGNVLIDAASIADLANYADAIPNKKLYKLVRETNLLYAHLLAGEIGLEEGVKLAEDLYLQRRTDPYYMRGRGFEGGNENNEQVVDFRLAAILKKLGSTVPTVHAWKW